MNGMPRPAFTAGELNAYSAPRDVADVMRTRLPPGARERLGERARQARHGRILAFGRWTADYGDPIDWHLDPTSGRRWNPSLHWSFVLRDEPRVGDVKHTWEAGRFPQAFAHARAAAFDLAPEANARMRP